MQWHKGKGERDCVCVGALFLQRYLLLAARLILKRLQACPSPMLFIDCYHIVWPFFTLIIVLSFAFAFFFEPAVQIALHRGLSVQHRSRRWIFSEFTHPRLHRYFDIPSAMEISSVFTGLFSLMAAFICYLLHSNDYTVPGPPCQRIRKCTKIDATVK